MRSDEYNMFIKSLSFNKIVIYGLSIRAEACFNWFAARFPNAEVIGFIADSPTEKQSFCGAPVVSANDIKQKQDAAIIYAERDVLNIEKMKTAHGLNNAFYIFYHVKPFFVTGDRSYPEQEIRKLYQTNDVETNLYMENFFTAKQHEWSLLLPLESINWIAKYNKKYWDKDDNDLSVYDELTFMDCGAYTGDSMEDFTDQYKSILKYTYALEADSTKQEALAKTARKLSMSDMTEIIMKGVSDTAGDFFIENAGSTTGKLVTVGEHSAQTTRIDDLNLNVIGKLCIKMDVEGLEMSALKGAAKTIKKHKPEMAICIYHQAADIYEIPEYIKNLCPEYKFIIRGGVHTVCYCSVSRF